MIFFFVNIFGRKSLYDIFCETKKSQRVLFLSRLIHLHIKSERLNKIINRLYLIYKITFRFFYTFFILNLGITRINTATITCFIWCVTIRAIVVFI